LEESGSELCVGDGVLTGGVCTNVVLECVWGEGVIARELGRKYVLAGYHHAYLCELEAKVARLTAERDRMRKALERIVEMELVWLNSTYPSQMQDIARAALAPTDPLSAIEEPSTNPLYRGEKLMEDGGL